MKNFYKALIGIFAGLAVVAVILAFAFNSDNNSAKKEIFKLVEKQSETVIDAVEENKLENILVIKGVTGVNSGDVTEVQCGGEGAASAMSYYGFYYYEKDEPVVMFNGLINEIDEAKFIAEGEGWSYTETNADGTKSDKTYYTEKIMPGFYYYEWHF